MLSGKQISEARKRKGLTQEALASELGVSRQTIAKWEQEISTPSVANAYKLMDILETKGMLAWQRVGIYMPLACKGTVVARVLNKSAKCANGY